MRQPNKSSALKKLRLMKVPVGTVLDVGVLNGTPELATSYPDKAHLLFEPIVEWNKQISESYNKLGIHYHIFNIAVSDVKEQVKMHTSSVIEGMPISHARMVEDPLPTGEHRDVQADTLDNVVGEVAPQKPYLLKIDIDGAELKVIAGAVRTLEDCSIVIIEAHHDNFLERSSAILEQGFELFDICDLCYYDDRLAQFDLIFIKSSVVKEFNLQIYRDGFDFNKYEEYSTISEN